MVDSADSPWQNQPKVMQYIRQVNLSGLCSTLEEHSLGRSTCLWVMQYTEQVKLSGSSAVQYIRQLIHEGVIMKIRESTYQGVMQYIRQVNPQG